MHIALVTLVQCNTGKAKGLPGAPSHIATTNMRMYAKISSECSTRPSIRPIMAQFCGSLVFSSSYVTVCLFSQSHVV